MESQYTSYMSPEAEYWINYQQGMGVMPGPMMGVMYPVAEPMVANNGNNRTSPGGNGNNHSSHMHMNNEACGIRDVWAANLEDEFKVIRQLVTKYCYVAMDTEFPGVVARPIGEFRSSADYQYQLLKCNVDLLKIIQLGLTFLDENGKTPPGYSTWQFNFKFNLTEDMYAQDSIDLLQNSGIQFKKHEEEGIDIYEFAQLLMTSGIVLMEDIKWLSFHSGYDFGYLLKLLTDQNLPAEESEFFELLRIYFPTIYDVKYLMKSCKNLKGGLQEVAEQLELERIGPQHQAGSDSLLTGAAFFKMREVISQSQFIELCSHSVDNMLELGFTPKFSHQSLITSKSAEASSLPMIEKVLPLKGTRSELDYDIDKVLPDMKKTENVKMGFIEICDKFEFELENKLSLVRCDDVDKLDGKYENKENEGFDKIEKEDALAFKLIFGNIKNRSDSEESVFLPNFGYGDITLENA